MEAVCKIIDGCCGWCRSDEEESSGSSGTEQHQHDGTGAVVDRQPGQVEPPMAVRVVKSIRQLASRHRSSKPTWEQLEAFYQEGKELARLQEEAEAREQLKSDTKEELKRELKDTYNSSAETWLGQFTHNANKGALPPFIRWAFEADPEPTLEVPAEEEDAKLEAPKKAHLPPPFPTDGAHELVELSELPYLDDAELRLVSNTNDDRALPASVKTGDNSANCEADTADIAAVLAAPDKTCMTLKGTQASKKMKLFFQNDETNINRSRSSVYPSDEESMVYPPGTWSPRSPRRSISPQYNEIAVEKIRTKSRHVSPSNLRIPSIFQVLDGLPSGGTPAGTPKLRSREVSVELPREIPTLNESEIKLTQEVSVEPPREFPSMPDEPLNNQELSVEHPREFLTTTDAEGKGCDEPEKIIFEDVLLTPLASPLLNPQLQWTLPPLEGAPFLKLELERMKRRVASDTFCKPSAEPARPVVPLSSEDTGFPGVVKAWQSVSAYLTKRGQRLPTPGADGLGIVTVGAAVGALSSLSSLSLASMSMQAMGSTSPAVPQAVESGPAPSDGALTGLPPQAEAESPILHDGGKATAGNFEGIRTGGSQIAKSIAGGFATLFQRFGARTAELQSTEPEPTAAAPRGQATPARSFTEGTPTVLSPTPSTITLMRKVLGFKVEGTLGVAEIAAANPELARVAMSSGPLSADFTDCVSDTAFLANPFEGHVWDAPDGKIPWYCDENGVHFDDKVSVGLRDFPAEYLVDPVIPRWKDLVRSTPAATTPKRSPSSPQSSPAEVSLGVPEGLPPRQEVPSASSSVSSFPRYTPAAHRTARASTCGLDTKPERAWYEDYLDRIKRRVKPHMRNRRSFQGIRV